MLSISSKEDMINATRGRVAKHYFLLASVKECARNAILLFTKSFCVFFFFVYLFYNMYSDATKFSIEATIQDTTDPSFSNIIAKRGQHRGRVASLLNAMTFSLLVNATLDKFGLIDPSTSTVLVGMTLGGTWGFVLDNMFGTDEGFREYLWSAPDGMVYAMGCLRTEGGSAPATANTAAPWLLAIVLFPAPPPLLPWLRFACSWPLAPTGGALSPVPSLRPVHGHHPV